MLIEYVFGGIHAIEFLYVSDPKYLKRTGPNHYRTTSRTKLVLLLSNAESIKKYKSINCVLLTSKVRHGIYVPKGTAGLNSDSYIQPREIYTIDKKNFKNKIGDLPQHYLTKVYLDLLYTLNFDYMQQFIFPDSFKGNNNLL